MRGNITRRGRGNITKRGKSWQIKFDVPSPDGTRKTRYATVRGTYQDAQKELTRLLNALDSNTLPEPTAMTVEAYLNQYLKTAHEQSPKTLERYGELAKNQIFPHLGSIKVRDLKAEQVRAWHSELLRRGLSPRTVGHAHRLLNKVLAHVVRGDTLKRYGPPKVEDDEVEILTVDQIAVLIEALKDHSLLPLVSLALATGMRRGELLGLQWGDVDLGGNTLRVERSVEETKVGLRLKPPKTKRGRRSVSLPAETVAMLRTHKAEQMRVRLALGQGKPDDKTLVFSDVEGRLLKPHTISRAWRRVIAAKKLPQVSFHALRHTHVSLLIRSGVDVLTISRRIGHSRASITLDVYGHLMSGGDEAAASAIGGLLK